MIAQNTLIKVGNKLIKFIQIQLFLTLMSLPILLSWGIPISVLSPIGNLIFAPVLTAFLFVSSLIFFTALLHIPNTWLYDCLNVITHWWVKAMNLAGNGWLLGFAKPSLIVLIAIPLIALLIIHAKKLQQPLLNASVLLLFFVSVATYLHLTYTRFGSTVTHVPCNRGSVTIVLDAGTVTVIDPGVIGQSIAAPNWIEYTLIPALTCKTGKTTIDHLVVLQPGTMVFKALTTLAQKTTIKNIYLVCWHGSLQKREWAAFFECKRTLVQTGCAIHRIAQKTVPITPQLSAQPTQELIQQHEITYPAIVVTGLIDGQRIDVPSYKCRKNFKKDRS